jgi:prepilin-type N-terminal cleavage/methylation domain-containing protein
VIASPRHPDPVASRPAAAPAGGRAGFSLVELLVVMSIMVVLVGLVSAAVAGARSSQKKQATRLLISKLDAIVQQQMATYAARVVPPPPDTNGDGSPDYPSGWTKAAYRSWYVRRNLITGDLPDRWSDVAALHDHTDYFGAPPNGNPVLFPKGKLTSAQKTYISLWHGLPPAKRTLPGSVAAEHVSVSYAGAECLFMIVMQGGIADCIDCGELRTADRGDKDGDGLFEFWDAWGNPIDFILWPAALQLPAGSGAAFFTTGTRTLQTISSARPAPALGMRPLIYSAGPDGEYGFTRGQEAPTITAGSSPKGRDCGNPAEDPTATMGQPEGSVASDNLTNLDAEALK